MTAAKMRTEFRQARDEKWHLVIHASTPLETNQLGIIKKMHEAVFEITCQETLSSWCGHGDQGAQKQKHVSG